MKLIDRLLLLPTEFLHTWGYAIIFIFALLEAVPLLGTFVPGHLIVIFGGFLAKAGVLNFWDVVLVASIAAILGDMIGYYLGKHYGFMFLNATIKKFPFIKKQLSSLRKLVRTHPGKTIVVGRFNLVSRAFAPFFAGAEKINFWLFMFYNIIGGFLWALSSVTIGYVFGAGFEVVSAYIGKVLLIAIIASIGLAYAYNYAKKNGWLNHYPVGMLILNIASLILFAMLIEDILNAEMITVFDHWISSHIAVIYSGWLTTLMIAISSLFSSIIFFLLLIFICIYLFYSKRNTEASIVLLSTISIGIFIYGFKNLFMRARPIGLVPYGGYSFPSGHAAFSTVFAVLCIYIFYNDFKKTWHKFIFVSLNVFFVLLVCFDRLYLNVHWFSDVISGVALGVFCATACILAVRILDDMKKL